MSLFKYWKDFIPDMIKVNSNMNKKNENDFLFKHSEKIL
jgi:hypothetical protein